VLDVVDGWVAVPEGQVFFRRWKPKVCVGVPVMLLHDSLGSVEQWRAFPEVLSIATQREVIAYDRLGFGKSLPRTAPALLSFMEDEAREYFPAVLKALDIDCYAAFGHSVGGGMSLLAASMDGNRCVAVISESAQSFVEERTLQGVREAKQKFADATQFARLEKWHGAHARWVLEAWTEVWLDPTHHDWSLLPALSKVTCPVLAIHGDQDEFGTEAFPRSIVEAVSGPAQIELLSPCGHVPHREREADVITCVTQFLGECP
jgi:pimeloyl-ACP methyl ester carboxylesterase